MLEFEVLDLVGVEGNWRSIDMHAYTKLTVLRQSLMLMDLF